MQDIPSKYEILSEINEQTESCNITIDNLLDARVLHPDKLDKIDSLIMGVSYLKSQLENLYQEANNIIE
jgi:hypothetical protein